MSNRAISLILMVSMITVLVSGCKGKDEPHRVTRAMLEPASMDLQSNVSMETGFIAVHVFDRLMEYDRTGRLKLGILAESPTVSSDGLTYGFKLKPGLKFSDKSPLTAEDVRYTIIRALRPETGGWNAWIFDSIQGAQEISEDKTSVLKGFVIKDDLTFEIHLSQPYVPFISGLASPFAGIIPSDGCETMGKDWGMRVIGSGRYSVAEWLPGKSITLVRNTQHVGLQAEYDEIVNVFSEDFQQNMAGFRSGAFNQISVPAEAYEVVSTDDGLKESFVSVPALNIHYLGMNVHHPILKDSRVREAISLAIDRERLSHVVLKDAAIPAHTFLPPGIQGHDEEAHIPFDPQRAKDLLAAAGYPNGFDLDYPCKHIIEADYALKSMLEQVGIRLDIRKVTHEERLQSLKDGTYTMILRYWWADIPDGDNFIYNKFNSRYNRYKGYANKAFDAMSEAARVEKDYGRRGGLYEDLDRRLCAEDWVVAPLYHVKESSLVTPEVVGFYIDPVTSLPMFP